MQERPAIPAGEKKNRIDRIACGSRIKKDGELLSYFSFNVVDPAAEGDLAYPVILLSYSSCGFYVQREPLLS